MGLGFVIIAMSRMSRCHAVLLCLDEVFQRSSWSSGLGLASYFPSAWSMYLNPFWCGPAIDCVRVGDISWIACNELLECIDDILRLILCR